LGLAGLPGIVHSTGFGVTLKSGQVLDGPLLDCNVYPALTIEGPGSFDTVPLPLLPIRSAGINPCDPQKFMQP